jgi:HK97 family phage prohead protease
MTGGTMTDRARMLQRRAAAAQANPGEVPNGTARSHAFGVEMRASTVIWKEQERIKLEGYASVVEKKYRMWDIFGEYDEVVSQGAFDETLSKNPDVAYLVNHRGVTMARTTNGSLELLADGKGLKTLAYVNPKRTDVRDLVTAIEDRDVTEMSFAFRIDDGEWSDDFTEFRIHKVDLDRGDVSAVNYGASPHTSVAARQSEIVNDVRLLPEGAQRAVVEELKSSLDAREAIADEAELEERGEVEEETAGTPSLDEIRTRIAEDVGTGQSVKLARIRLAMLED